MNRRTIRRTLKRPSYREAVEWIALNDDAAETDLEVISGYVSIALVSDLFGKDRARVACDVHRRRLEALVDEGDIISVSSGIIEPTWQARCPRCLKVWDVDMDELNERFQKPDGQIKCPRCGTVYGNDGQLKATS